MRAIVTCITVTNWAGLANQVQVNVGDDNLISLVLQAQLSTRVDNLRCVGYGGERMSAYIQKSGCSVTMAGFLLEDPTSASGPPLSASSLPSLPEGPWQGPPPST